MDIERDGMQVTCWKCKGLKMTVDNRACNVCNGSGVVECRGQYPEPCRAKDYGTCHGCD